MHINRFAFNLIALVYLVPLMIMDFVGNTISTGSESEHYFYMTIFDALLIAYAGYALFTDTGSTTRSQAQTRKTDTKDSVVDFTDIGAVEYVYCAVLAVYAAANAYFMHALNKQSTGFLSMATLLWTVLSIIVLILAAVQFYHLKQGKIVQLVHKATQ